MSKVRACDGSDDRAEWSDDLRSVVGVAPEKRDKGERDERQDRNSRETERICRFPCLKMLRFPRRVTGHSTASTFENGYLGGAVGGTWSNASLLDASPRPLSLRTPSQT